MKLYVSNTCQECRIVEASPLLRRINHTLLIRNVDQDPRAIEELAAVGSRSVPTLVHGHLVWIGADSILNYLAQ